MEKNSLDTEKIIKFKIERENENPLSRIINKLFILSYCVITVVAVYFFITSPSVAVALIFLAVFFLLTTLLELVNEYLNTEYITFKIADKQFIIIRGSKIKKFDIDKCKIEYNMDKTDWLSLDCADQHINLSLGQRPTKELLNFIRKVSNKGQ